MGPITDRVDYAAMTLRSAFTLFTKLLIACASLAFLAWGALFVPNWHLPPRSNEVAKWIVLGLMGALFIASVTRLRLVWALLLLVLSFVAMFASCSLNYRWGAS
jgi:hypothetical protein